MSETPSERDYVLACKELREAKQRIRELEAQLAEAQQTALTQSILARGLRMEFNDAQAALAKDDDLQHQTNMAVIELRNELARVQAIVTCAAEDLEARASLEGEHTACAMMCIAKVLTAALAVLGEKT